ncbi:RagB/SusD family nutrient uptake outer membrane protein [Chitinophaga defluvii]|uniref:RagB/SusD family nutrient uptake outer membrane protein n=1 Tax=Chitinophaga defluvii TaxID=3163343 RepID=A0ABV2TB19_9BACT
MMNYNIIKRYTWMLVAFCLASCSGNFLDPANPTGITADEVWKDPNLVEMFVNGLYNDRPGYDYSNTQDNITDEGRCNYPGDRPNQMLAGQWDESYNPIEFWKYDAVRKTNEFMANADKANVTEETRTRLKGEVRFLRAFLYFDMVKRYGGVPIIDKPQTLDDDLLVKRNSLEECFDFIVKELDIAIGELPDNAPRGRAGKVAAMALKGRALLYFASPLYNAGGTASRWEDAAKANKAIIDLNKYSLFSNLNTLWLEKGANPEALFEIQYRLPEKQHSWDAGLRPLILANNNAGQLSPLQELVDAFPMKNGKAITDPTSGYDENNPYVGRDDRFYAFIAFNGSKVKGTSSGPPVKEITLETYKGGRDYDAAPENIIYNTKTSYYTRKATDPENTIYAGNAGSSQPWIEFRYAEVLLNYAEAQNEFLSTPDASIYSALNLVRKRAGITTDLVAGSLDKQKMRELIRNERYIELCFEQKRYWDLRRWKLATTVLNGKYGHGAYITKHANNTFTYEYLPIDPQPNVFTERMYWMPIPQGERSKNKNLTQNPGWN